mmetsp:Transcript_90836/g.189905  ORF Transcript_90836/g.189905 Transcript_90836/m.189905 type:complete len:656 (+) Transcript_90836:321-2288(+)
MGEDAKEKWRKVLAESNQEMLRELAAHTMKACQEGVPQGKSMEDIALEVADRILNSSAATQLLESDSTSSIPPGTEDPWGSEESVDPLLEDLEAVPWNIWSGSVMCPSPEEKAAYTGAIAGTLGKVPNGGIPTPLSKGDEGKVAKTLSVLAKAPKDHPAPAAVATLTKKTSHSGSTTAGTPPSQSARSVVLTSPRNASSAKARRDTEGGGSRCNSLTIAPERIERSRSVPFDARRTFERKFSEVFPEGYGQETPTCGATMHAGLRLLTTTQEHTWMQWHRSPKNILFVAKRGDLEVAKKLREMLVWADSQSVNIIVESALLREMRGDGRATPTEVEIAKGLKLCWCSGNCSCPRMRQSQSAATRNDLLDGWCWGSSEGLPQGFLDRLRTWTPGKDELEQRIDLVICIGGDGSLCWAAGLFSGAMPPVIAFAGGSLGFLTPFAMDDWMDILVPILGSNNVEVEPVRVACRMRFQMRVFRGGVSEKERTEIEPIPVQALNEVLVHRGSSGHLVKLEVWVGKTKATMVQGDGLIIATPTGSTAYSAAAGGSMLHPSVPGIILTPVCPHSLSFRPVVLPDSAVVVVRVPTNARSSRVMVAVDGKDRIELMRGDAIEVKVSPFPLPTVCKSSITDDWFLSVNEALQWNLRLEQKGLPAQL